MNPPHLKSKQIKTAILLKDPSLKKYVPQTAAFSHAHLRSFLAAYPTVFVKPDCGRFGRGVMKIAKQSNSYTLRYLQKTKRYNTFSELLTFMKKRMKQRKYILQQGIQMLTYRGRPFDIRVMVQRTRRHQWKTTGVLARVAAPGKIVTNYHAGGSIHPLPPLIASYLSKRKRKSMLRALRKLGREVARHYNDELHQLHEVGVDVALDHEYKPWILEVNTRPDAYVFDALRDKTMFRNIMKHAQAYGKYETFQKTRRERL